MADVDPFDGLDDEDEIEEETPTPAAKDSSVITQLRQQLRAEKRARKEAESRLTEVEPFREKYLSTQAPKVLEEAGVDPTLARLFVKDNPTAEITADLAKTWAAENGLPIRQPEEAATTNTTEGTFTPTVGGESPGFQRIKRAQLDEMLADPARAGEGLRLLAEGRVEFEYPEAAQQAGQR